MLAEAEDIDSSLSWVLLLIALLSFAAVLTLVFGFVLARRAGRGSRLALGGWVAVLIMEGLWVLSSLRRIPDRMGWDMLIFPAVMAGQLATFVRARSSTGP
jgi:hypothetical protein